MGLWRGGGGGHLQRGYAGAGACHCYLWLASFTMAVLICPREADRCSQGHSEPGSFLTQPVAHPQQDSGRRGPELKPCLWSRAWCVDFASGLKYCCVCAARSMSGMASWVFSSGLWALMGLLSREDGHQSLASGWARHLDVPPSRH